jgi:hypothetical protein
MGDMAQRSPRVWLGTLVLLLVPALLSGCFLQRSSAPRPPALIELKDGEIYGPVLPPPIFIRLGQSVVHATGSVGPSDGPEGSPAIWEGHALALEPDRERSRTVFFYVQGDDLRKVSLQINDHEPIVDEMPGAYLSGEFTMVRWAQDYSLRVTAEDHKGNVESSTIYISGEDARLEGGQTLPPLRMKLMRLGGTETRDVQGIGYQGKIHRHAWPLCGLACDPTVQGGALVAMVSGPADTLALIFDERYPFFATGLSYWPNPDFVIVAIPVRNENIIEIAALSEAGDFVQARWDRPQL